MHPLIIEQYKQDPPTFTAFTRTGGKFAGYLIKCGRHWEAKPSNEWPRYEFATLNKAIRYLIKAATPKVKKHEKTGQQPADKKPI